jgi:hypothetical protein
VTSHFLPSKTIDQYKWVVAACCVGGLSLVEIEREVFESRDWNGGYAQTEKAPARSMARTVCCDKVEPGETFVLLMRRWNLRLDCLYHSHGPHAIASEEFDSGLFQIRGCVHSFPQYLYCPAVGFEFEDVDKPMLSLMSVSSVPDSKPVISRMTHLSNSSARRE